MGATVTDAQVAAYAGLVESVADQLHRPGRYIWKDDLEQEGLIAVWHLLSKGQRPNAEDIVRAMKKWIRREVNRGVTGTRSHRGKDDVVEYDPGESANDELEG